MVSFADADGTTYPVTLERGATGIRAVVRRPAPPKKAAPAPPPPPPAAAATSTPVSAPRAAVPAELTAPPRVTSALPSARRAIA